MHTAPRCQRPEGVQAALEATSQMFWEDSAFTHDMASSDLLREQVSMLKTPCSCQAKKHVQLAQAQQRHGKE